MLIPKGAQHKRAAEAMIDFVYDVANAARLAAWIYYISPVKGVAEEIAAALARGLRTADIKSEGCKIVSTREMGRRARAW